MNHYAEAIAIIADQNFDAKDVAIKLAQVHPSLFVDLVKGVTAGKTSIEQKMKPFIVTNGRVAAVKKYRELTGCGLKEALDAVTVLYNKFNVVINNG